MAVEKDNTARQYTDIKKEFTKLSNVSEFGAPKYSEKWIYAKLAHIFYKSPKTIENIVFNRC